MSACTGLLNQFLPSVWWTVRAIKHMTLTVRRNRDRQIGVGRLSTKYSKVEPSFLLHPIYHQQATSQLAAQNAPSRKIVRLRHYH